MLITHKIINKYPFDYCVVSTHFVNCINYKEEREIMKNRRFSNWTVAIILLCCLLAVVFFPFASDNREIYKAIIYTSIVIVFFLLLYFIKLHVSASGNSKQVADH